MTTALHLAAFAGYLVAWLLQFISFRSSEPEQGDAPLWLAGAATVSHAFGLAAFSLANATLPLVGLGPASSTLALAVAIGFLAVAGRRELRPTGLFVLPIVLFLLAQALAVGFAHAQLQTAFAGAWFVFHVTSVFLGYAALLIASVAAIMFLLQFRSLTKKQFGSVFRSFPSLDALDRLRRLGLAIGLAVLTIGLLAGWSFTLTFGRGLALSDPEVLLGVLTWVVFLAALTIRSRAGGTDHKAAIATTLAFGTVAVAFLVLRAVTASTGFFL